LAIFDADPSEYRGATAQIAGFGLTNHGLRGQLEFAVETVVDLTSTEVIGRGVSGSGACDGDSGGPMIVRDDHGVPSAIGLLSAGSAACNQTDDYLRLDVLASWIRQTTGGLPSHSNGCDLLSAVGRCFSGLASWCDGSGHVAAQRCGGSTSCGWSVAEHGYRCVSSDPCSGIDSLGACRGASGLAWCDGGKLTAEDCGVCGGVCMVSGTDATAHCLGMNPSAQSEVLRALRRPALSKNEDGR
jgi:hypothetical protein